MVHIKGIITIFLLVCFSLVSTIFVYSWKKDIIFYKSTSFDSITESNYKLSIEKIEKLDEHLCNIVENLQTSLAKKTINTTDRVLLNLFFITILQNNNFIKSFELVLPNKYEYKIVPISSGWKTVSFTAGGKGFVKKEAIWTEDGTQLLEEEIEEVGTEQSITNSNWYKETISLCLQQDIQNREGIPKLWFTPPEINEIDSSITSKMAMAVGYEDSPFSVVSWEIDWSCLQNVVSNIYRECSVYTYILTDKYVIARLGMENISSRDISKSVSFQNLPEEIKISYKDNNTDISFFKKDTGLLVVQKYQFMYSIPLTCIFDAPYRFDNPNTNKDKSISIYGIILLNFLVIVCTIFLLGYLLSKPIKEISLWLESPKIEEQESPLHFWIIEYETLMNKVYSILYFWKFWAVDIDKIKSDEEKENISREKKVFIFSEEGKGGIPIETVNTLYRENIRLQRQIESLNQYYLNKIDMDSKEKIKVQGFIVALRDIILNYSNDNRTNKEKIKGILEITQNTLKTENIGIWKIDEDNDTLLPIYIIPEEQDKIGKISNCKFIIENLEWSEVLTIRSAKQDYRSNLWAKVLDAESFIFSPLRLHKDQKTNQILITYTREPKNWEPNDENFVIIVSRILSEMSLT